MDGLDVRGERGRLRISQSRLSASSGISRFKIVLHERGEKPLNDADLARVRTAITREAELLRVELSKVAVGG